MTDFDPHQVAIRPAATVMLVADRPDLQVLMLRRDARTVFAGGMWVFPGGRVDEADDHVDYQAISEHRTDAEASRLLGLPRGGLAYYIAAIRECFEEAGVLLARRRSESGPIALTDPRHAARFERLRERVNEGALDFLDLVRQEDLVLDAGGMHYIAHWITPLGSPRRFSARFFLARMPANQAPLHDDRETVHSGWWTPARALQGAQRGELQMISVTERMLRSILPFASADAAMAAAAASDTDARVRVDRTTRAILLPGEPGYDDGDLDIETGWIRLRAPT